ncbi:MAG TPA: AarF/UbiB family protein [Pseudonocardia sp.]|jgi:predicted unusual protein kinase regulating ubiquinone biosynthesis (AarF/ABC1/UbiB family)
MTDVFAGPYSAGPPAEALVVRRPPLRWFGPAELLRIGAVLIVLGGGLLLGQVRWLVSRWRGRVGGGANREVLLAEAAVTAFSRLGPVFTKLGQFMASSPGLFPAALSNAARRCLDDMPPFPARRARRLIAEQLGAPVTELFTEFTDHPLAAASIAQVHACVLPDGRAAVVKLRRPGIERRMITDLRIMYRIARILDRHVELARLTSMVGVVEQLYEGNCQELNFALEASQQQRFRAAIGAFEDNRGVMVPEVYWDYCGPGMICMERVYGIPMDNPEQLAEHGLDGELPLRRGVKAWLEAAILHGPFHGDAHAGNLWILDDGRLGYLDFGIMGELAPPWRRLIRDVLYTLMFDRNFERIASALRECGVLTGIVGTDAQLGWTLRALFEPLLDSPVSGLDTRKIIDLMLSTARQHAGENPPELTLFAKQLVYFERYSAALAPGWVFAADPYVVRNIFPAEATARAAQLGLTLPD